MGVCLSSEQVDSINQRDSRVEDALGYRYKVASIDRVANATSYQSNYLTIFITILWETKLIYNLLKYNLHNGKIRCC